MKKMKSILLAATLSLATLTIQAQEIFDAIKNNDLSEVKSLVEADISTVNLKDNAGNTPLHFAAIAGSVEIIELLLSNGADINSVNNQEKTPLHESIANKQDYASKVLIERGADIDRQDGSGKTPLHATVLVNAKEIAELLISKGADLEKKNKGDFTPLGLLTRTTKSFEVAEVLVKHGANINAPWTDGAMPLNYAAMYSDSRVIDLLLDHNADFDITGENLVFTLSSAINKGHVRLFKKMIEKCGDSLFNDPQLNKSLLRNAIIGNSIEIVKILQSKNIPLDLTASITGATPLHSIASNLNASDMIEFLVKNGVDINARTNDGRSAYNIAEASENKEAMSLLIRLGANSEPQKFPVLTGPYMGQSPPDKEPKRFAPGIVYPSHSKISISPDGKEMYWGNGYSILFSKIQNGRWTRPDYVSFSGENEREFYDDVPFVTPDNTKLFFTSLRPIDSLNKNSNKENIWFVERIPEGWSEPKPVSAEVNSLSLHWQVSVSNSGNLYFGGTGQDNFGNSDIYCSNLVNGEYSKPVNLGSVINSENGESMPYISPDESFIIFYRVILQRPSLYISFKGKDGQWLQPISIVHFTPYVCGIVSPDEKYFFFDNRWISAEFIEELRPN